MTFFLSFFDKKLSKKGAGKLGRKDRGASNLGKSIIRAQFPTAQPTQATTQIETERGKGKLRSVTQCDDLEEFMSQAVLAGTESEFDTAARAALVRRRESVALGR